MNIVLKENLVNKIDGWVNHFCLPSFFKKGYEVNTKDIADYACLKAYSPSVNRALYKDGKSVGFKLVSVEQKNNARREASEFIKNTILDFYESNDKCYNFNIYNVIEHVKSIYVKNGIDYYTIGNAQKFVSMAFKYFNCLMIHFGLIDLDSKDPLCGYNYSVVDGIMIKNERNAIFRGTSWSKCDDINVFKDYQKQLKDHYENEYDSLAFYEIMSWNQN